MPPTYSGRKKLIYATVLVAIALVSVALVMVTPHMMYMENAHFKRGSLSYYFRVSSDVVKNFPTIDGVNEASLFSGDGDGPKPPLNGIHLISDAGLTDSQIGRVDLYVRGCGFTSAIPFDPNASGWEYSRGKESVHVRLVSNPDRRELVINHFDPH